MAPARLFQFTKVPLLALGLLLCWVPGSQAAVFAGSATDPGAT